MNRATVKLNKKEMRALNELLEEKMLDIEEQDESDEGMIEAWKVHKEMERPTICSTVKEIEDYAPAPQWAASMHWHGQKSELLRKKRSVLYRMKHKPFCKKCKNQKIPKEEK